MILIECYKKSVLCIWRRKKYKNPRFIPLQILKILIHILNIHNHIHKVIRHIILTMALKIHITDKKIIPNKQHQLIQIHLTLLAQITCHRNSEVKFWIIYLPFKHIFRVERLNHQNWYSELHRTIFPLKNFMNFVITYQILWL